MRIKTRAQKILALFLALSMAFALMPMLSDEQNVSADTLPALSNVALSTDGVLSWSKFDGAKAYIYSIGNNCSGYVFEESLDIKSKCMARGYDSGTYEVTLFAVTDYPSQTPISATYTLNYQYTALSKLSTPSNLKWEGSIASWDSVTNADSYDVYLYCITENGKQSIMFEISYENTTLDMNDWLKDGTNNYCFEVQAKGYGHPRSDVAESPTASLTKSLPALKNIVLSSAGVLSWSEFDGAGAYFYRIGEHCSGVLYSESLDVYSKCVDSGYDSGNYTVKVYAVTENAANAVPISKTYEFDYNYVAPHSKLSTPANLAWNGSIATWDAVPNAEYYEVTLVDKQNQGIDLQHTWSVTATSFDMQDWFVDDMYGYRFWVVAKATGYPNSDLATSSILNLYTVIFDNKGIGTSPSTQIVVDGDKAEKPADPSANGYSFDGWYTDPDCTQAFDFETAVTANVTLYAKWKKDLAPGWNEIDGKYYYADSNGELVCNSWIKEGSKTYYVGSDGARVTGRQKIDGDFYYFKTDGRMATGWKTLGNYTYYFDPATGKAVTGWQTIDGDKYYFKSNGKMATGWKVTSGGTSYYLDPDTGKAAIGLTEIEGKTYYFDSNGKMKTGLITIGNYKYYFDDDGVMQTGKVTIDGALYYFKTNGRMATGWKKLGNYTYYFDPETGIAVTGWQTIDGYRYYFKSNGKMYTGWKYTSGGASYYFDPDTGIMVTGWQTIDGYDYYFDSNGKLLGGYS